MKLGELIVAYRKEHKLSQRQFAKKCGGLSNGYISMIENDFNPATNKGITPSIDKLVCIASGMDMSVSDLLQMCEDMPSDLSDVVAQNVIYEDESDAEIVNLFIKSGISNKPAVSKSEPDEPSPEALSFARCFDNLDRHGREVLRAVLRVEEKRCEEMRSFQTYLCDIPEK